MTLQARRRVGELWLEEFRARRTLWLSGCQTAWATALRAYRPPAFPVLVLYQPARPRVAPVVDGPRRCAPPPWVVRLMAHRRGRAVGRKQAVHQTS